MMRRFNKLFHRNKNINKYIILISSDASIPITSITFMNSFIYFITNLTTSNMEFVKLLCDINVPTDLRTMIYDIGKRPTNFGTLQQFFETFGYKLILGNCKINDALYDVVMVDAGTYILAHPFITNQHTHISYIGNVHYKFAHLPFPFIEYENVLEYTFA